MQWDGNGFEMGGLAMGPKMLHLIIYYYTLRKLDFIISSLNFQMDL